MKYMCLSCFFIWGNFLNAQVNMEDLKNDYIIEIVKKNFKKNFVFYESYSKEENIKYLNLIKSKFEYNLDVDEMINQSLTLSDNCEVRAINLNVFILRLKSKDGKQQRQNSNGDGEFIPNKVTLTYKWKIIDNYLYFIFTNRPLSDSLQKLIYIR